MKYGKYRIASGDHKYINGDRLKYDVENYDFSKENSYYPEKRLISGLSRRERRALAKVSKGK